MSQKTIGLAIATAAIICHPAVAGKVADFPVEFPANVEIAGSPSGFVPDGWRMEAQARGDLNCDGIADVVLVLRKNLANEMKDRSKTKEKIENSPQTLLVLLGRPQNGYVLSISNRSFIPSATDSIEEEYLDTDDGAAIEIEHARLIVRLKSTESSGSWVTVRNKFVFRYAKGELELIAFERFEVTKNSGKNTTIEINYITRNVKSTDGNYSILGVRKTTRKSFPPQPLITMGEIGNGLEFYPEL